MKISSLLVLICPLLILILSELFLVWPKMFFISLILIPLIIFFSIKKVIKESKEKKNWFNFSILPIIFSLSGVIYSILLTNKFFVQLIFVAVAIFVYFYFRNVYYYLNKSKLFQNNALENISSYGNFIVMFFSFSAAFGLQAFLNLPVWSIMLVLIPVIFLVSYQVIWVNKIPLNLGFVYIAINTLVLFETAWAASFLPFNHNALGLALAICYYILIGIIRFHFKGKEEENKIRLYLFFGLICILIILLSSRWM